MIDSIREENARFENNRDLAGNSNQLLLLVIDLQNVYTPGQVWECESLPRHLPNILRLLERSENAVLTRFTAPENPQGIWQNYNAENENVNASAWLNELIPQMQPYAEKFPVLNKSVYSALGNPRVRAAAEAAARVAVTGVVAECCVLSTVLELIDAGIYVYYITDGVSGISSQTEKAVETVLSGLSPLHLSLLTTEEYLRVIGDSSH